jgi:hypothetical protein
MRNGETLTWGYDRPLQSYFIQLEDIDDELIFDIGNIVSLKAHPNKPDKLNYSNAELLEVLQDYTDIVPKAHIDAITLDLEF